MESFLDLHWPLFLSLYLFWHCLAETSRARASQEWPTTEATVHEVPARTRFERTGTVWRWRSSHEIDYVIKYSVRGIEYHHDVDELWSMTIGGTKAHSSSGLPDTFLIRYKSAEPTKVYYKHAYPSSYRKYSPGFLIALGSGLLSYYVYSLFA